MAIIATTNQKAEVRALGSAMNATVNFSGALMEMLSTVYVYILMAAIREAVQNACDASRRAGLSFAEGVQVILPTASNPVITVIDKGSGMSREFMESTYLSFGSSTKAGDNGSAGGLGVGRWAAYGYIRECYIATCHEEDMVERTYFQFQGDGSTPQVQLAAEVPGKATGTRVYFPVKEHDIDEALFAVAWLKEIMQLTTGDSFSVDTPAALPDVLPEHSGTVLELGSVDKTLEGVRLYPMMAGELMYSKTALRAGSLVVMTNREAGVGGLPFHVQASGANTESVFANGFIIEVPLAFNLPFMPSREELKYTDEVTALLKRIDAAAALAAVAEVERLYKAPDLVSKGLLSNFIGNSENWHWFCRDARGQGKTTEALRKATGGEPWRGSMVLTVPDVSLVRGVTTKFIELVDKVFRETYPSMGRMVRNTVSSAVPVTFKPNEPVIFVVNDLKAGGQARCRQYLKTLGRGTGRNQTFMYFSSETPGAAKVAADSMNAVFGHQAKVLFTSSFPEAARVVVGTKVVKLRSRGGSMPYYCFNEDKQKSDVGGFTTYLADEPTRIWLGKTGGQLAGFNEHKQLSALMQNWSTGTLKNVLKELGVNRLYLLSEKQIKELSEVKKDFVDSGIWDLAEEELGDDQDSREAFQSMTAVKSWMPLEDAIAKVLAGERVQGVLNGTLKRDVSDSYHMTQLCKALAVKPRLELTGTTFDKMVGNYVDLVNGKVKLHTTAGVDDTLKKLCEGLKVVYDSLEPTPDDSKDRQEMMATLKQVTTAGFVNYEDQYKALCKKFPLLEIVNRNLATEHAGTDHLCQAMAVLYK